MATQRYISTSFWDDKWIRSLDPSEKFIYLYLMTNPLTNIAGVYEITIDRICFDTGYNADTVNKVLKRFEESKKAYTFRDYIIIPSWPKHQKWQRRSKIRDGIVAILENLPPDLLGFMELVGYTYPIDTLSVPYTYPPNYSDTEFDSDTDTDINTDSKNTAPTAAAEPHEGQIIQFSNSEKPKNSLSPLKDETANEWQNRITEIQPPETWANFAKERKHLNDLGKKTRALFEITPFGSESQLIEALIKKYLDMREREKGNYWRAAPVTPSGIITRWDKVTTAIAQEWQESEEAHRYDAAEAAEFF